MTSKAFAFLFILLALLLVLSACGSLTTEATTPPPLVEGINGRVMTSSTVPVEGATIQVFQAEPDTAGVHAQALFHGITDTNGYFRLSGVPAGTYHVLSQKNTLGVFVTNVQVTQDQSINLTLTAHPQGAIKGRVVLEDASNALGIDVFVPDTSFSARTDDAGNFLMTGLPEGTYRVVAQLAGYERDELYGIQVTSASTVTLARDLSLVKASGESPTNPEEPAVPEEPGENEPVNPEEPKEEEPAAPEEPKKEEPVGTEEPEGSEEVTLQCGTSSTTSVATTSTGPAHVLQTLDVDERLQTSLPYVPEQLLVRYQQSAEGTQNPSEGTLHLKEIAEEVQAEYGLSLIRAGGLNTPDLVQVAAHVNIETLALRLAQDPRVAYAEPNYYLHTLGFPNDTHYSQQWNMSLFGIPQAWDVETGKSSITIAVIDTGVDTQHEDLAGRLLPGCDFHGGDNDPNPGRRTHHGTHVAGIAAANGNNGKGVAGVAYTNVKILPVKVFSDSGLDATLLMVADAIRWSAGLNVPGVSDNPDPAHIINLSLGANGTSSTLNEAVADAHKAGTIVIAAAGNESSSSQIMTPANAPDAIAVGSVDSSYLRSDFSNYSESGRTVALMAPGGYGTSGCVYIASTLNNNGYGCMAGTSMATPFVAGVAALVWSQNPTWTAQQVMDRLLSSTYFDPSWSASEYGNGVICADRALGASTLCGK